MNWERSCIVILMVNIRFSLRIKCLNGIFLLVLELTFGRRHYLMMVWVKLAWKGRIWCTTWLSSQHKALLDIIILLTAILAFYQYSCPRFSRFLILSPSIQRYFFQIWLYDYFTLVSHSLLFPPIRFKIFVWQASGLAFIDKKLASKINPTRKLFRLNSWLHRKNLERRRSVAIEIDIGKGGMILILKYILLIS